MTDRRDKALGEARADLVALPDLVAELARCLTERNHDVSGHHKVIGSPAPLQIQVVHLTDTRHKSTWDGDDPRLVRIANRYGVTPVLESWVRVLTEEMPERPELAERATVRSEAAVLVEAWSWIVDQKWAEDLADDVRSLASQVRAALGIRPEYRPSCRKCGSNVIPVDAERRLTSWEACAYGACTGCEWSYPKGPALDALAKVQDPLPLKEISGITGVPIPTLHRWHKERLIVPIEEKRRGRRFDLAAVNAVAAKLGRHAQAG